MAKKKIPTLEDAIKSFKEVLQRAALNSYYHVNDVIISKNDSEHKILVIPNQPLWEKLLIDPELSIKELFKECPEDEWYQFTPWVEYGQNLDHADKTWIDIDVSEELFNGKVFKIQLDKRKYQIPINRELMPMKLKKAEYTGISYRVFTDPLVLAIKKRFEFECKLDEKDEGTTDCGFTMIRLFQVI